LIVQTIKQKKNQPTKRLKEVRGEKPISLGKKMKFLQQAVPQQKVKKQTCVLR